MLGFIWVSWKHLWPVPVKWGAKVSWSRESMLAAQQCIAAILRTLFNSLSWKIKLLYSPDLAFPDFFYSRKSRLEMKRTFFMDVKAIHATATRHLRAIPINEYLHSFQSLYRSASSGLYNVWRRLCWSVVLFSWINFIFGVRKNFYSGTYYTYSSHFIQPQNIITAIFIFSFPFPCSSSLSLIHLLSLIGYR